MTKKIKKEWEEFRVLLRCVPPLLTAMFILSVCVMNLLANKSVGLPVDWLALDCGIFVSWLSFLSMDMLTKHFGPKAAVELSVLAMAVNAAMCAVFFLVSRVPGTWGESYVPGSEDIINNALNSTFGGTWYIIVGSAFAFFVSSVVNNFSNWGIGMAFKKNPDGFASYAARTYISTAIGQFTDNLVFALVVSHRFFGWSLLQCVTCALTGMAVELVCEVLFSGFGYRVIKRWKQLGVGEEYFRYKSGDEKQ